MARADLLRAFHVHARSVDPEGRTLGTFMRDHAQELADAFGTTPAIFAEAPDLPDAELAPQARAWLEQQRVERVERQRREQRETARQAARRLGEGITWCGDRAVLDVPVLLGPVLVDATLRFVAFIFPSGIEVLIERTKLIDLARAVTTLGVVEGWVEVRGLFIAWMRGRGRILLYPQAVTAMPTDRVLRVVLSPAPVTPAPKATSWLGRWTRAVLQEVVP